MTDAEALDQVKLSKALIVDEQTKHGGTYVTWPYNRHLTPEEIAEAREIKRAFVKGMFGKSDPTQSTPLEGAVVPQDASEGSKGEIGHIPSKLARTAFCSGACGRKIKLPVGETKKCPDCQGTFQ